MNKSTDQNAAPTLGEVLPGYAPAKSCFGEFWAMEAGRALADAKCLRLLLALGLHGFVLHALVNGDATRFAAFRVALKDPVVGHGLKKELHGDCGYPARQGPVYLVTFGPAVARYADDVAYREAVLGCDRVFVVAASPEDAIARVRASVAHHGHVVRECLSSFDLHCGLGSMLGIEAGKAAADDLDSFR
ncbi:MAG: hypothetical protein IAE82_16135 [Opitutaceae bacterium]|nr:hypothetical protein [Opitutaceae bacterium]